MAKGHEPLTKPPPITDHSAPVFLSVRNYGVFGLFTSVIGRGNLGLKVESITLDQAANLGGLKPVAL